MTRVLAVVLCAALSAASPALAKPKPRKGPAAAVAPTAAAHVAVARLADGWRADIALDGPLLGWALPRDRDGRRALFVLAGTKSDAASSGSAPVCTVRDQAEKPARSARLLRWRSESPDALEPLGSGLPDGTLDSADVDGDGAEELLLQHDGTIDVVTLSSDGSSAIRTLVEEPSLGTTCCGPRMAWDEAASQDTVLRFALLGAFRSYGPGRDGGVAITSELETPERVITGSDRVTVRSPAVRPIGRTVGRDAWCSRPIPNRLGSAGCARSYSTPTDPRTPASSKAGRCSRSPSEWWTAVSRCFKGRPS